MVNVMKFFYQSTFILSVYIIIHANTLKHSTSAKSTSSLILSSKNRHVRLNSSSSILSKLDHDHDNTAIKSHKSDVILKIVALSALVIQNSGLTITMRLSRIKKTSSELYISSTAVVCSEFMKLFLSILIYYWNEKKNSSIIEMFHKVYHNKYNLLKTTVPSTLYVIQNNLQYLATSNLPAEIYQVLIQMKLIATALLSSTFLGTQLNELQWFSIFVLFVGVAVVQFSLQIPSSSTSTMIANYHPVIGITAVLISCITSGFAGVYNEKLLKDNSSSLWARNIQMSTISFLLALLTTFVYDRTSIFSHGFFKGYDSLVWMVILLQALGNKSL